MKHLIINGADLGTVQGYRQNRELSRWSFLMNAGYYIGVDFSSIKSFESSGNLEIITFRDGVQIGKENENEDWLSDLRQGHE